MSPLTSEQQELACAGLQSTKRIAARYKRGFPRLRDDIESEAMLGLLRAASEFDHKKIWGFWLRQCIQWQIGSFLRTYCKHHEGVVEATPELLSSLPDPHDPFAPANDRDTVEGLLGRLGPKERRTITELYWGHQTQAQIACQEGVEQHTIHYRREAALKVLREQDSVTTFTKENT